MLCQGCVVDVVIVAKPKGIYFGWMCVMFSGGIYDCAVVFMWYRCVIYVVSVFF